MRGQTNFFRGGPSSAHTRGPLMPPVYDARDYDADKGCADRPGGSTGYDSDRGTELEEGDDPGVGEEFPSGGVDNGGV